MLFSRKNISKNKPKITSIDQYNSIFYQTQNNTIKRVKNIEFDEGDFIVSTIDAKDFISTTIEISVNIPDEDLQDIIELKAYEELELDQALIYIIRFEEILDSSFDGKRYFNVFAVERSTIEKIFKPTKKQIKFIDAIYPKPHLIQNIYENGILDLSGVHGFLYFQKEDTFITLYKDGRYLYSKSIKYSFETIYEYFCRLYGKKINRKVMFEAILKGATDNLNYDYENSLENLFNEIFSHINDILLYAKRVYEIDSIELFFVGSTFGKIDRFNEYISNYLYINPLDFDFDYGIEKGVNEYIDQFHYLSCLEAKKSIKKTSTIPNFTLFFRPPPFIMRHSGKLVIAMLVAVILSFLIPAYNYMYSHFIRLDIKSLQNRVDRVSKISSAIYSEIDKLEKSKKSIESKIETEKKNLEKNQKVLQAIYEKKVNYLMKAKTLAMLGNDMSKFGIHVTKIKNKNNQFMLSLYACSEKDITNFIKYLSNHYDKIVHTDIENIYKDKKSGVYRGDLKIYYEDS